LTEHAYEYMDELGLLYLPGFDARTRHFYGKTSHHFVDHPFVMKTDFDNRIRIDLYKKELKKAMTHAASSLFGPIRRRMKERKERG